jgi:hypothetical protein
LIVQIYTRKYQIKNWKEYKTSCNGKISLIYTPIT